MFQSSSKEGESNAGAVFAGEESKPAEIADSGMDGGSTIERINTQEEVTGYGDNRLLCENVEEMIGQPWSKWAEKFGCESAEPDQAAASQESDCMKLPREDMPIYGLIPEKETFTGIICELCEATVHPGGLVNHYRIWHSGTPSETKSIPELPDHKPIKRNSSKKGTLMKTKVKRPLIAPTSPTTVVSPPVPDETVEIYDNVGAPKSPVVQPVVSLTPLDSPSTPLSSVQTTTFSSNVEALSQLQSATAPARRRPKTDRKCLPIKEREYDPDKHCGVWIGENSRPCTRSLTCKSHSLSMRRAVSGRSKNFDLLLADHRAAKEAQKQKQMAVDVGHQPELPAVPTSSMSISQTTIPSVSVPSLPDINTNVPKALSLLSISPTFSRTLSVCIPRVTVTSNTTSASALQTSTITFKAGAVVTSGTHQTEPEDVNWLKTHPRPLAVCSFSERKIGALLTNSRRLEVVREGLKEALTNGPIRSPLGNDFYGNTLQASTNHATATIKTVLTNICTKSNFLGPRGKLLVPNIGISKNHKMPIQSSVRKSNTIFPSTSGNNIQLAGSLKAALQKPQHLAIKPLNQNATSKETSGKTGQFHIPNILGGSLKRQGEVAKGTTNVKRAKRKPTANVNPAEILGSLFGRKSMPLVTVAIANGGNEAADSKNVFTELQKGTANSDAKGGATNIKAVTQNVRIAAAPSAVQIAAAPQITYLTTAPVTFQQIPVLSQQVISQIQLQSKNSSGGGSQSIPLKLSLAATTTMDHSNSDS